MRGYYYKIADGLEGYISATDMDNAAREAVKLELTARPSIRSKSVNVEVRADGGSDSAVISVDMDDFSVRTDDSDGKIEAYLQETLKDHEFFRNWGYGRYRVTVFGKTEEAYGKKPLGVINPYHFKPDCDSNTEEEINSWKLACEKWDEASSGLWSLIRNMKSERLENL